MKLQERYAARSIRFLEIWRHEDWRIKLYGIAYRGSAPDPVLIEAAKDLVSGCLPRPAVTDQRPGVGFVGVHQGRGSNLVVSDRGFSGVVIHLGARFSGMKQAPERETSVIAGAGIPLPMVANWAARRGLAGLEFLVAIPGSIGGAVRMNAGAHGREIGDCLGSATIFDLAAGRLEEREASALGLSYRRSALRESDLVLEARFELETGDVSEIKAEMDSYRRHRA
jgi:UDP-N-acetylenolpyruvoylglucosamine reductase